MLPLPVPATLTPPYQAVIALPAQRSRPPRSSFLREALELAVSSAWDAHPSTAPTTGFSLSLESPPGSSHLGSSPGLLHIAPYFLPMCSLCVHRNKHIVIGPEFFGNPSFKR